VIPVPDLSNLNSEQLEAEIFARAETYAKSDGDALARVIPYIKEMQGVLSQRPKSDRNKEADGVTFSSWLSGTIKKLKKSLGKDVAVSRMTIYRRLAKQAGFKTIKTLKPGTLVREKLEKGDMGEARMGRVEDGKLAPAPEGFTNIRSLDGDGNKLDAVQVKTDSVGVVPPRKLQVGDLVVFTDIDGGSEHCYDGAKKFSRTLTPTVNKSKTTKANAKQEKKDREKIATGATPGVGGNPGQVSDAKAAENAKRHKPVVVTPKLVKAEDSGAKKTTITDTTIVGGKPGPTYGEVIQRDILKPAPKPKAKPGPKPKVKTVAPSPDSEPRKGFEVQTSREYDPELGEYVTPEPDAHREKLIAGAAPAGVEPITTEETAA
jgi:hypothetical protein